MKSPSLYCFFACLLFSLSSFAQSERYYFADETYFVKEVSVKEYVGRNFRYTIAVKANPADSLSKVRIHGAEMGKGNEDFINSQLVTNTQTDNDWTIYTLTGKIENNATRVWMYAAVNGNGDFYFDDVEFYVEETPGNWKKIALTNASFEDKSSNIFAGYYISKRSSSTLKTKLADNTAHEGHQSILIQTSGLKPIPLSVTTRN